MKHASKRRRGIALLLAISMVLSLFAAPVSARANIGFEPFFFPGGPIFGPPIIIAPRLEIESRALTVTLTGDAFRQLPGGAPIPDVNELENWVLIESSPDFAQDLRTISWPSTPADRVVFVGGGTPSAPGFTLETVTATTARTAVVHLHGYVYEDFVGSQRRFYLVPNPTLLQSGVAPAPLIIYIGIDEVDRIITFEGSIQHEVFVTHMWGGNANPNHYIPFGINPSNYLVVELTLDSGAFFNFGDTAIGSGGGSDPFDIANWYVDQRPIVRGTTPDSSPRGDDQPSFGMELVAVTRVLDYVDNDGNNVYYPDRVRLLFHGVEDDGGMNVHGGLHAAKITISCDDLADLNDTTCACALHQQVPFEAAAQHLFVAPVAGVVVEPVANGSSNGYAAVTALDELFASIPINVPSIPMDLRIIRDNWFVTTIEGGRHIPAGALPDGVTRNIVVEATLLDTDGLARFSALANQPQNWYFNYTDEEWTSWVTSQGHGNVRGLMLQSTQVMPGGRTAQLTFVTTSEPAFAAIDAPSFGDVVDGLCGAAEIDCDCSLTMVNRVFTLANTGSGVSPTGCPDRSVYSNPNRAVESVSAMHLYVRALPAAILAHSTFYPYLPVGVATHRPADMVHPYRNDRPYLWASFLTVGGQAERQVQIDGYMTATGTVAPLANNPRGMRFDASNITEMPILWNASANRWEHNPSYVPHYFLEGIFRSVLAPYTSQAFRDVYVSLGGGLEFASGAISAAAVAAVNNVNNWSIAWADFNELTGELNFDSNGRPQAVANSAARSDVRVLDYFTLTAVQRMSDTVVRVTLTENYGVTTNATSDFLSRPFLITFDPPVNTGLLGATEASALVNIAPFIPATSIVPGAPTTPGLLTQHPRHPGVYSMGRFASGHHLITIEMHGDTFTPYAEFRRFETDGNWLHLDNWEIAWTRRLNSDETYDSELFAQIIASWDGAVSGNRADSRIPNTTDGQPDRYLTGHGWQSAYEAQYVRGLRMLAATVNPEGTVTFSFAGMPTGHYTLHIRATSAPTEDVLDGERALTIAHRHTQQVTIQLGYDYGFVIHNRAMVVVGAGADASPRTEHNSPFDVLLANAQNPGRLPAVILNPGLPVDGFTNIWHVDLQLQGAQFHYAGTNPAYNNARGIRHLYRNTNNDRFSNWQIFELGGGNNRDISDGLGDVAATGNAGWGVGPNQYVYGLRLIDVRVIDRNNARLTFVGEAELHANAILGIRLANRAIDGMGDNRDGGLTALVRIGHDLRPALSHTDQNNETMEFLRPGHTETVRVWAQNDWFTRYAEVETNWELFVGLTDAQATTHRDHAPGATGIFPYAALNASQTTHPLRRFHDFEIVGMGHLDYNTAPANANAFSYVDIQIRVPVGYTLSNIAIRPAFNQIDYDGSTANPTAVWGNIPALLGGTTEFDRLQTTIPFPVELLILPIGARAPINPNIQVVDTAILALEELTFAPVVQPHGINTAALAEALILNYRIPANIRSGLTVEVNTVSFTPPVHGTADSLLGTTGHLVFTMTVTAGTGDSAFSRTTAQRTLVIDAAVFVASDTDALSAAITTASQLLANTEVRAAGTLPGQVDEGQYFVTNPLHREVLETAIEQARLSLTGAEQSQVNSATAALNNAIAVFRGQSIRGTRVVTNFTPLANALRDARAFVDTVAFLPLGTVDTVLYGFYFITESAPLTNMNTAIAAAQAMLDNDDATPAQVEAAVDALEIAFDAFYAVVLVGEYVATATLSAAIAAAIAAATDVEVLIGATPAIVEYGVRFVNTAAGRTSLLNLLGTDDAEGIIERAQEVLDDEDATQAQIDAQVAALNSARNALENHVLVGTVGVVLNFGQLNTAIANAQAVYAEDRVIAENANTVSEGTYFWTADDLSTLAEAIATAIVARQATTQTAINTATGNLQSAVGVFQAAARPGVMTDDNGGEPGPGEPLGSWGWGGPCPYIAGRDLFYFQFNDGTRATGLSYVGTGHGAGFDGWFIFNLNGYNVWNLSVGTAYTGTGWAWCDVLAGLAYYIPGVGMAQGVHLTTHWVVYHTFDADHRATPFSFEFGGLNTCQYSGDWFFLLAYDQLLRNDYRVVPNIFGDGYLTVTADANGVVSFS